MVEVLGEKENLETTYSWILEKRPAQVLMGDNLAT